MRRAALALLAAACRPTLADTPELVAEPRIVAVQAEPAEAPPGGRVTLRAFVATPDGPAQPALEWAFCLEPKPLAENNVAAPACLGDGLPAAGPPGPSVDTTIPADACRRFGPETPPQTGGMPPARPRDPDGTGGYYQPVRVTLGSAVAIALVRIRCPLAQASLEVAQEFQRRYVPNQNPRIDDLAAAGGAVTGTWSPDAAETYPRLEPASQALIDQQDRLTVEWLATAPLGATSLGDGEARALAAGPVHVWLVLRDDRGGVDVRDAEVAPP